MPAKNLMTWDPKNRRWRKLHAGRRHVVSCAQLGVAATKEASAAAANRWWQDRLAALEADARPPRREHQGIIDVLARREEWARAEAPEEAEGLRAEIERLRAGAADGLHPSLARALHLGPSAADAVWADRLARRREPEDPAVARVGALADRWLAGQEARVKAGATAVGTWRNNRDCLARFRKFAGEATPVAQVNEDLIERFFNRLMEQIGKGDDDGEGNGGGGISRAYAHKVFGTARAFARYLAERGLIPAPRNLDSRAFRFHVGAGPVPTLTVAEFGLLLKHARGQMGLHLLLMANCGFTQLDVAELKDAEVDWAAGRIIRKRSKTEGHGAVPVVNYKLWPATLAALRAHRSGSPTVLLTASGAPWVFERHEAGKLRSNDSIATNYKRLRARIKSREGIQIDRPLKVIRKTSATLLGSSEAFGRFAQHFLGHAPRTVADRHYVAPAQPLFDDALAWLGRHYGL